MQEPVNRKILVIDDQESIHQDFKKILGNANAASASLQSARSAFFGPAETTSSGPEYELEMADQGEKGIELFKAAHEAGKPFAMAFVDVRMPPGLDGIRTIQGLWAIDPTVQIVICTAFSDYSFEQIVEELGYSDRLLILKKPFDPVEVRQLASALTEKWTGGRRIEQQMTELEEARTRAEDANKAKSEFLANMSHEIRTPMNALLGYVDLLCDPEVTADDQAKYGETIRKSGEHLLTILNDILDISRVEASRMVVHMGEFSPFDLAREVCSLMLTQASEKDLALSLEVPKAIPEEIESDHVRVRQILLNLVGNAIKFTPSGSVRLVLSFHPGGGPDGAMMQFEVIDTGVGIPADQCRMIFDAFSQADTSSTRLAGGTGLGLAISKRLSRLLGGDVTVESEEGQGSRFTVRLRAGDDAAGKLREYTGSEVRLGGGEEEQDRYEPVKLDASVLLVEDVKFNQLLVSTLLKKAGASVTVAENGAVGCDRARQAQKDAQPFDLILMDMQMPVMDGYDATRALRAEGFETPIVALTAHAMAGDRDKCLDAGCTDYLTKPLDRKALLQKAKRLIELDKTQAPLPDSSQSLERSE